MSNKKFNARHGVSVGTTPVDVIDDTGAVLTNAATATKLLNSRTISISGDVVATGSFDGSGNLDLAATIQPNSVALGTDTTGNYMVDVSSGTGVSVSHTQGEGSTATISIGQAVGTTDNVSFNNLTLAGELRGPATFVIDPAAVGDNTGTVVIKGNLQIDGTTTTINSTTLTVDDLVLTLGGDTAPASDDTYDKGIEYRWYDTQARVGFFGFDRSTGKLTFIPQSTLSSGVYSGTTGEIDAKLDWSNVLNKPTIDNTTYNILAASTTGGALLRLNSSGAVNDDVKFASSGAITVAYTDDNTITVSSNATSSNTVSTIVARDGSGNFSAGTITAALSGNASTATKATNLAGGLYGYIPYQSTADTTTYVTFGTSGQMLFAGVGAPYWGDQSSITAGSATNIAGGLAGNLLVQSGVGGTTFISNGTVGQVLFAAATPYWGNLPTIGNGTFGVSIGAAGATNTTVTWGTSSGFSANTSSNYTYDLKVGPALTALATLMTTAGAGFIKRGATADTYTIDTNTYLTGNQTITLTGDVTGSGATSIATTLANSGVTAGTYSSVTVDVKGRVTGGTNPGYLTTEADTLATVTGRGATTGTDITLGSGTTTSNTYLGASTSNYIITSGNGNIYLKTKDQTTTYSRNVQILTGNSTQAGSNSGGIIIKTGNATGGSAAYAGDISMYPGTSDGVAAIVFIQGGESVSGTTSTGGYVTVKGGSSTTTTGTTTANGGNLYLYGGDVTSANSFTKNTGSVYIEGGGASGSGTITFGTINIGRTSSSSSYGTSAVNIGNSSITTTVSGTVKLPNVGTSGFVKLGAGGQLSADTNTYLTSYTETDTLSSVTGRGNSTSTNIGSTSGTALALATTGNVGTWIGGISDGTSGWALAQASIGFKSDNTTYAAIGIATGNGILYFGRTTASGVGTMSSWLEVDSGGVANFKRARPQYNGSNLALASEIPSLSGYLTSESDTLATVTARGATTSTALTFSGALTSSITPASIATTTPGLVKTYGFTFNGASSTDNAQGITWTWDNGGGAQAGIYVQSSGAYGTKMYIATTDSFATGAKTAISIDHGGIVNFYRARPQWNGSGLALLSEAGTTTNSVTFNSSGGAAAGTTFNGSAAKTIDYSTVGAAASGHNHTYNVNDAWLRDNNDDANVKLYGNSRQMAFRTDGTTEYATGVGGYPFAWMYGGDAASQRIMLLNTSGDLWTSTNGWLSTALAGKQNTGSYLTSESDTLATVTARGASTSTLSTFSGGIIASAGIYGAASGAPDVAIWMVSPSNPTWGIFYNEGTPDLIEFKAGGTVTCSIALDNGNITTSGSVYAASKSFLIPHPTKEGWKLRYGSLEGPENGVYIRGKLKGKNKIELPEYWTKLVDPDSITVTLTPIGKHQKLYVEDIADNVVTIANDGLFAGEINCFFVVYGERVDIDKLVVEYE